MLDSVLSIIPATARSIRVRADSGFYDKDFVAKLSANNIGFAVVAKMTQALKNKLPGLRYSRVNKVESTAQFKYQPSKWKQPYKFVVLREKLTEERKEQLKLIYHG